MVSKILTIFLILIPIIFVLNIKIHADQTQVYINEFLPNPEGSDTGKEFVELYNPTDQEINLEGWKITTTSASDNTRETILPNVSIQTNSYFIVKEAYVNYSANNSVEVELNMYNAGVLIQLIDSENNIVDSIEFGTGSEGKSWERSFDTECEEELSQHVDSNSIGIQNSNFECANSDDNTNPSPQPSPEEEGEANEEEETNEEEEVEILLLDVNHQYLIITEIYPSPDTGAAENEWVEIYNPTEQEIELKGLFLSEELENGKCKENDFFETDFILFPNEHFVINEPELHVTLNNSGDDIYLCNSDLKIDSVSYGEISRGDSYVKKYDGESYQSDFEIVENETPGEFNQVTSFQSTNDVESETNNESVPSQSGNSKSNSNIQNPSPQPSPNGEGEQKQKGINYELPDLSIKQIGKITENEGNSFRFILPILLFATGIILSISYLATRFDWKNINKFIEEKLLNTKKEKYFP